MNKQQILTDALADMNSSALYNFKSRIRDKIGHIVTLQETITKSQEMLATLKADLKAMEYTPIADDVLT